MAILVSVPLWGYLRAPCYTIMVPGLFQILSAYKRRRGDMQPGKLREPDIGCSTMSLNLAYTSHPPLLLCACCDSEETPPWSWPFCFIPAASSILYMPTSTNWACPSFPDYKFSFSSFFKDQLKICSGSNFNLLSCPNSTHIATKGISHPQLSPSLKEESEIGCKQRLE